MMQKMQPPKKNHPECVIVVRLSWISGSIGMNYQMEADLLKPWNQHYDYLKSLTPITTHQDSLVG